MPVLSCILVFEVNGEIILKEKKERLSSRTRGIQRWETQIYSPFNFGLFHLDISGQHSSQIWIGDLESLVAKGERPHCIPYVNQRTMTYLCNSPLLS
ncbi:unnamed protein product [Callosobruchus maculatus]|uniref:Uncharacterized protein n=1 Tax=Callosobruchus maculatus TaxID=64391 RepID=A0A653CWF4_CALMS|nr:unnamed protein product [Callosobruchus maculatus]